MKKRVVPLHRESTPTTAQLSDRPIWRLERPGRRGCCQWWTHGSMPCGDRGCVGEHSNGSRVVGCDIASSRSVACVAAHSRPSLRSYRSCRIRRSQIETLSPVECPNWMSPAVRRRSGGSRSAPNGVRAEGLRRLPPDRGRTASKEAAGLFGVDIAKGALVWMGCCARIRQ